MKILKFALLSILLFPMFSRGAALVKQTGSLTPICAQKINTVARASLMEFVKTKKMSAYAEGANSATFGEYSAQFMGQYNMKTNQLMVSVVAPADSRIGSYSFVFSVEVDDRCQKIDIEGISIQANNVQ